MPAPPESAVPPGRVLRFWFSGRVRPRWFRSTPALDAEIRRRFQPTYREAVPGNLAPWEATARGALALVITLDQFPLNMYRGQPASFAGEAHARRVAERAIARGLDAELDDDSRAFLYLPFMHSESLSDQDRAVQLYEQAALTDSLRFARHHREIIARFGRFPHRNVILGRESTGAERAYLGSESAFQG